MALLVILLLVGDGAARRVPSATWSKRTIPVYDYTAPGLYGYVQQKVDEWNAALGGRLTLIYQRQEPRAECEGVPAQRTGAMVICSRESWDAYPAGLTKLTTEKRKIVATRTTLVARTYGTNDPDSGYWSQPLGCHELGHALGLKHPGDWDDDTCLGVQRDTPSEQDRAALRRIYRAGGAGARADRPGPDRT